MMNKHTVEENAARESQITRVLIEQRNAMQALEESIEELTRRLESVLHLDTKAQIKGDVKTYEMVTLAREINNNTEIAISTRQAIIHILECLEL